MRQYHGLSKLPLYRRWKRLKGRCYNMNTWDYKHYGGRGIKVCDEWLHDFKAFSDYVMALDNAMAPGMTIDRIDGDKDYAPKNIQWATMQTQCAKRGLRKSNTSGYIGVSYIPNSNRWKAYIMVCGKEYFLKTHHTPELAAQARNNYIIENNLTEYQIQTI